MRFPDTPSCDSNRIQTCNLLIRSQMLYSVELRSHFFVCDCKVTHFFETNKEKTIFYCRTVEKFTKSFQSAKAILFCGTLIKNLAGHASGMQIKQALCIPLGFHYIWIIQDAPRHNNFKQA